MSDVNIYKKGLQQNIRFASTKGLLTIEQLFELPLTSRNGFDLDTVAKSVHFDLKEEGEGSFVEAKANARKDLLELALEIVKDVIQTKQDEAKAATKRRANQAEKARLTEILHGKKDEALQALTPEQIQDRINALDADE